MLTLVTDHFLEYKPGAHLDNTTELKNKAVLSFAAPSFR